MGKFAFWNNPADQSGGNAAEGRRWAFEQTFERWRHQYQQYIPSHPTITLLLHCSGLQRLLNSMKENGVVIEGVREGVKKKLLKSGQADRLGRPPLPLPRSGQENVKIFRQVVIFGVILPFYKGQNGSKFSQNRSGQTGGGVTPPKRSA